MPKRDWYSMRIETIIVFLAKPKRVCVWTLDRVAWSIIRVNGWPTELKNQKVLFHWLLSKQRTLRLKKKKFMKTGWIISSPEEHRSQCKCEQKVTSLKWTTLLLPMCHWPWWYFTVEPKIKPSDLASCAILTLSGTKNNFMAFNCLDCAAKKRDILLHISTGQSFVAAKLSSEPRGKTCVFVTNAKINAVHKVIAADWRVCGWPNACHFVYMKRQSVPFHVWEVDFSVTAQNNLDQNIVISI